MVVHGWFRHRCHRQGDIVILGGFIKEIRQCVVYCGLRAAASILDVGRPRSFFVRLYGILMHG